MKKLKFLSTLCFAFLLFTACSDDDDSVPEMVIEEELITTMTITLTPDGGGDPITLQSQDLDGDGPDDPVLSVSGNLAANTAYVGSIVLLNETESPAEDITEEIEELDEEHQFFYTITGGLDATAAYLDFDANNNPVGLAFSLTTGAASNGTLTATLRHEPKKPNDGTLEDAGGATDITVTFSLVVQ